MIQKYGRTVITALVLIGAGLVVIALGWNGSARANCVDCQIPYLLSGGALGIALIAIGSGLLMFEAGKRAVAHLEAKLDTLIDAVRERPLNGAAPVATESARAIPQNGAVVVGKSSFHRLDCRLVEGKDDLAYASLDEARERGLQPCRVCEPLRIAEPAAAPGRRRRR